MSEEAAAVAGASASSTLVVKVKVRTSAMVTPSRELKILEALSENICLQDKQDEKGLSNERL